MRTRRGYALVSGICGAIHRTGRICKLSADRPHDLHITEVPTVIDPAGIVEWADEDEVTPEPVEDVAMAFVERRRARLAGKS